MGDGFMPSLLCIQDPFDESRNPPRLLIFLFIYSLIMNRKGRRTQLLWSSSGQASVRLRLYCISASGAQSRTASISRGNIVRGRLLGCRKLAIISLNNRTLSRIIRVPQDVIKYREWVMRKWTLRGSSPPSLQDDEQRERVAALEAIVPSPERDPQSSPDIIGGVSADGQNGGELSDRELFKTPPPPSDPPLWSDQSRGLSYAAAASTSAAFKGKATKEENEVRSCWS